MRLPLLLALAVPAVSAQADWRPAPTGASVSADALYALGGDINVTVVDHEGNLDTADRIGVTSSVVLLSGRVPIGSRWALLAEIPLG